MMGGDYAPLEAVKGVAAYLANNPSPSLLFLIGNEAELQPLLVEYNIPETAYKLIASTQVIGYKDHPTKALREKPDSSITKGFGLLAQGTADAFISAGNTGAMLVGSMFMIKPIEGVLRPTIGTIIPKEGGKSGFLLDVGLNSDCKPEHLNQFAVLGSIYAKYIYDIQEPRVGLLNIGEEEGKGNLLAQGAYPLLKENPHIIFAGNVEGRDILEDKADVIVCDGYTGNVLLKVLESLHTITTRQQIHHDYFDRFNFEMYGGTPVLGIDKPVIIGHGVSGRDAFKNKILLAEKIIETGLLAKMKEAMSS